MTTRKAARIINAIKCSMVTTPEEHEALTIAERVLWEAEPIKHGGWIPISARVPDKSGFYLTTTMYGEVYYDFWNSLYFERTETVIAWAPLPEPYKEAKP